MKTIKANYESFCAGCGGSIAKGSTITGSRGGDWYHGSGGGSGCAPSGDTRADAEYLRGARDVENWRENRALFGEEEAERMEIERELRDGDGW